ncbi:HAD family hydrolase [Candidatus Lokiarchaeum ossiferum]|uniref:HAD family hydrolase n=1 Tax=Candidatus Lokiarchaeum ossiferum TaxID=2951803 RepID=UPI00352DA7EF
MRKFLVFDLGETLIDFNMTGVWREQMRLEVIPKMFTNLKSFHSTITNFPQYSTFLDTAYASIARGGYPVSMINRIKNALTTLKIPFSQKIINSLLQPFDQVFATKAKIYPQVKSTLEELKNLGYILGLWSNTPWQSPGYMSERVMNRFNIREYFSAVHFSGDYEIRKPNAKALEIVQKSSQFKKDDMIYIGNAEVDIQTGCNFGIPTVWIKRNGDILSEKCPRPTYELNSISEIGSILPIQ